MKDFERLCNKLECYLKKYQNQSCKFNDKTIDNIDVLTKGLIGGGVTVGAINSKSYISERLDAYLKIKHITFSDYLFELIYEKKIDEKKLYSAIGKDSKFMSKIRCNRDYHPSKKIVCALALEMKLTMDETENLLSIAGYSLNFVQKFDLIIRFSIEEKIYSVHSVQALLEHYQLSF